MKNLLHSLKENWIIFFIIFAALCVQCILFYYKDNLHLDEIFSFALANNAQGLDFYKTTVELDNRLYISQDFMNYLVQTPDSSFSKMWSHLSSDNHMPLFFVCLRLLSGLFPAIFTVLPGVLLNSIVLFFLLLGFYLLTKLVFQKDEIVIPIMILFAFAQPVLSLEVFIRMYLMWMMWAVYLLLFTVKIVLKPQVVSLKHWLYIYLFSLLLILTHYYGLFFSGVLMCSAVAALLLGRYYRQALFFAIILFYSFLSAFAIYPEMFTVGLHGERGVQFVQRLFELCNNPSNLLHFYISPFSEIIYGQWGLLFLFVISLIIGILIAYKKKYIDCCEIRLLSFFFLLVSGYNFLLLCFMPVMVNFQIRYFAPIIPVFILLGAYLIVIWEKIFHFYSYITCIILLCISGGNSIYNAYYQNSFFYMRNTRESSKLNKIVKDADIWWGIGGGSLYGWTIYLWMDKLALAHQIWTLYDWNYSEFLQFSKNEVLNKKYAYLLLPKIPLNYIEKVKIEDIKEYILNETGRHAFHMFTVHGHLTFETEVYLVAPY